MEERAFGAVGRQSGDQGERTHGEDFGEEGAQVECWEAGVDFADEVFVEPLCGFDLEGESLFGGGGRLVY